MSRVVVALAVALALAVGCRDATSPDAGPTGTFVADSSESGPLPVNTSHCGFAGCTQLVDFQLRFRSRGRVLDLRRFRDPGGLETDIGDAYAYHLLGGRRIEIVRQGPAATYSDTGTIAGDTIRIRIRKLEPQFGGSASGPGTLFRLTRVRIPQ